MRNFATRLLRAFQLRTFAPILLSLGVFASTAQADNVLHPGTAVFDRPTLTALGIKLPLTGDDNFNASVSVRYRVSGASTWSTAQPLFRVHPETVGGYTVQPQFAGSIFDLRPGQTYDVELHIVDPDGPVDQTVTLTGATRTVPKDPATPRTVSVNTASALMSALGSAQPGDVITLADGVYAGQFYTSSAGTAQNPIVIRGTSEEGTIIDGLGCIGCNVLEIYGGGFIHIERLTIQNAERAIRFQTSGAQGNVVRRVHIKNVIMGIAGRGNQVDSYITDNILEGRLAWPLIYEDDGGAHSDDTGIAVEGFGHVVAHNQISGFGDAMKSDQDGARANDFYGNDVLWTYDNGLELDYSEGNARALRNRFTNAYEPLSVQPTRGGPVYMLRNVAVNSALEQMKFHAVATNPPAYPNGVFAYHNTFVSPSLALTMQGGVPSYHFAIENNLFIGPSQLGYGYTVDWTGSVEDGVFDYNGYWPDGTFNYKFPLGYKTWANFSAMQSGGWETHATLLNSNVLANGLIGSTSYKQQIAPQNVTLSSGSLAVDRGLTLPNINDNFTGSGPDLGALELGCPMPIYGPRPEGTDESNEPFGCTTIAPPPPPPPTPSFSPIRINAGGGTYTDPQGIVWSADTGFLNGYSMSTAAAIRGTTTPVLYQTERFNTGTLNYGFAVPNGNYIVKLKFAEIQFSGRGKRVFTIVINGNQVQMNFDAFGQAGGANKAIDKSYSVSVTNGRIDIAFVPVVSNPEVNGIEITADTKTK